MSDMWKGSLYHLETVILRKHMRLIRFDRET